MSFLCGTAWIADGGGVFFEEGERDEKLIELSWKECSMEIWSR